ncbi:MAG: VWA domain-containing protein [Candidatus Altiarchaeota archaeon]|nr:VWA domain-containing protein [Candidatus Altiarchaeota archaeon]
MDIPQVDFSLKYVNLLIILIGLVMMLYLLSKKYARSRTLMFGNFEVLEKVAGKKLFTTSLIPLFLRVTAVVLVILIISDLVLVREEYIARTDFILAIDTSSSMLTDDYEPNRIEFVKKTAIEFVTRLKNTKIGVITFSGKAHVRLKPTSDMGEVERTLKGIDFEGPAGTAVGDAIVVAESLFDESERNRSIILITDGRNNIGRNITEALVALNTSNTPIYPIGIGSKIETETTVPTELVGLNATPTKFPNLDESMLSLIANSTNGRYFIIDDEDSFKRAFETGLDYTEVSSEQTTTLVFLLCIVLLIDWGLEVTKFRVIP